MTKTTYNYAKTTDIKFRSDVLSDAMSSLRVCGSVLLNEDYESPWGVKIPSSERLGSLVSLSSSFCAVAFHYVKRGYLEISLEGQEPLMLEAGEMAICFGGAPHKVSQGEGNSAISVETLLSGGPNPYQPDAKNKARSTSLMCGLFIMSNLALNPLFSSLPPLLHVTREGSAKLSHLPDLLSWISHETEQKKAGGSFVVERLLELIYVEALRSYLESINTQSSWFAALKDPVVGRAISLIHAQPGIDWTVNRLADAVAMSPSRFAARFSTALGQSPMAYVTQWRMNVAGRLLGESQSGVGEIAGQLGYENLSAFTRAFKRHLGVSPAQWRLHQEA